MAVLTQKPYQDGSVALNGLVGVPEGSPRAVVTIFPTFINSTPSVEDKAKALVKEGYAVFIADFYGPDAPTTPDEAFAAMATLQADPEKMRVRLRASLIETRKIAPDAPHFAIGFCLGGMAVLEMARAGEDLAAVVSFHGLLVTSLPAEKPIKPRILICHGDADGFVPRAQVIAFWEEMDKVGANWHLHSYAGVDHGFTIPRLLEGAPNPAYDKSADLDSWNATLALFDEMLAED